MPPAVVVEGLSKHFGGDIKAVDDVSFDVPEGQVFGFLGPNGAGKSTTVRVLCTLLRPTDGDATIAGHSVRSAPHAVRRNIGVALQDAAIDPFMTGRELLRLQAVLHGIPRRAERGTAADLLERVGLEEAGDRQVGTYSGGMRRRLDLALALVHAPKVLFLDEPTTGLDPTSRFALWDEVRRLNSEFGTTVFLTTQYLEEADQLADRVAIIDKGCIQADGTPAALKAEVGDPTLTIAPVEPTDAAALADVLSRFGQLTPCENPDRRAVRLPGGAARLAEVVREIDSAGIATAAIDLAEPSLDDVFLAKTGRLLEGSDAGPAA